MNLITDAVCSSHTHTHKPHSCLAAWIPYQFLLAKLTPTFQCSEVTDATQREPLRLDGLFRLGSLRRWNRGLRQSFAEAEAEGNDREGEQVARQPKRFVQIGKLRMAQILKTKYSEILKFSEAM